MPSARQREAQEAHRRFLESVGYRRGMKIERPPPPPLIENPRPRSETIPVGVCPYRWEHDNRWKKGTNNGA
jgi:hypothetical protein